MSEIDSEYNKSYVLYMSKILLNEEKFLGVLRTAAQQTIHFNVIAPRTFRYFANIPKWVLTHGIALLHFESTLDRDRPPLTVASLLALLSHFDNRAVCKNTAASHLAEMRAYGLLEENLTRLDRRTRPLVLTARVAELVRSWFDGRLQSLDCLDGGNRLDLSRKQHDLLYYAHPAAIRMLLSLPAWWDPPLGVATFAWVESGSSILHDLLLRVPDEPELPEFISVGRVRTSDFASQHIISRSHAQRLFARARELSLVGWEKPGNGGTLWISRTLVEEYRAWQAIEFTAIALAWEEAVSKRMSMRESVG